MDSTCIVTGASGFIGSHVVDHLLEKGYRVIGIDNMRTGRIKNLESAMKNDQFRLLKADIRDENLAVQIREEAHTIFHLAAISSVKISIEDPLMVHDINVNGTLNILELARKLDVTRFVFSSSASVYGNPEEMPVREDFSLKPLSPYASSKIAGEMYVNSYAISYGVESSILRYFNVYGPRQAYSEYSGVISIFINQALTDRPITIEGDGEQTRSFVHVTDVSKATILAGELTTAIGSTINMSGIELVSINRIAQIVKNQIKGSKSEITHVPPRIGDVKDSIGNIERAQKLLGFTPEIPLDRGLQETADWYRSHL